MIQPRRPTRETVGGRVYLELRRHARSGGRDTGELLQLYALEGFLDRLTRSPYTDRLVLKGGVLLAAFDTRRPTRDIDVAGVGLTGSPDDLLGAMRAIAAITVDDGLRFDAFAATATVIREDTRYGGVRVSMPCVLERAKLPFHVDVNLGDPIVPGPRATELPRLLGGSLRLLGYPLSMVIAEKLVTAVERGQANTRWRDFGDLFQLSLRHDHDGTELMAAVEAVASHRGVELYEATLRQRASLSSPSHGGASGGASSASTSFPSGSTTCSPTSCPSPQLSSTGPPAGCGGCGTSAHGRPRAE